MSWTQPQCERCWIEANGEFDLHTLPNGQVVDRLVSLRKPIRLVDPPVEACAWCGALTISGIYVRADPASVPYPATE